MGDEPRDRGRMRDEWLKAYQHIRYMWIPHTDAVVVVASNPVGSGEEEDASKLLGRRGRGYDAPEKSPRRKRAAVEDGADGTIASRGRAGCGRERDGVRGAAGRAPSRGASGSGARQARERGGGGVLASQRGMAVRLERQHLGVRLRRAAARARGGVPDGRRRRAQLRARPRVHARAPRYDRARGDPRARADRAAVERREREPSEPGEQRRREKRAGAAQLGRDHHVPPVGRRRGEGRDHEGVRAVPPRWRNPRWGRSTAPGRTGRRSSSRTRRRIAKPRGRSWRGGTPVSRSDSATRERRSTRRARSGTT